jgi:hypothetical protein
VENLVSEIFLEIIFSFLLTNGPLTVLRGANVFAVGVLCATANVKVGTKVGVFVDVNRVYLKGSKDFKISGGRFFSLSLSLSIHPLILSSRNDLRRQRCFADESLSLFPFTTWFVLIFSSHLFFLILHG